MALRCIVADDEPLAKMLIENYVLRTPGLELAGSFTSAAEARAAIEGLSADLAFLDIQMPGISGLQLARVAEQSGVRVIFTTAYREYALDGFRVNALDYLLKPVSYEEFLVSANRAMDTIPDDSADPADGLAPAEDGIISVHSNYRLVRVKIDDIVYIESFRDYLKIHIAGSDSPLVTQMSLKAVGRMLPAAFVRIHRSYIVGRSAVKAYNRSVVTVLWPDDETKVDLPVGDTYRENFLKLMADETAG